MLVIALSLGAALCFALAVVLQQHEAAAEPPEYHLRPSLVVRLAHRPLWLAGIAASGFGTLLQMLALWRGSLVTVQPLLVCGLLFALPINALVFRRRRPGTRELLAAGVVCVGLALFLVATDPQRGTGGANALDWVVLLGFLTAAVLLLVGMSLMSRGAVRAGLLASAAGVINGLSAAFAKGVARDLGADWNQGPLRAGVHLLANWELYAFAGALLVAVLLVQSAFQAGPIRWSLPALTAVNPVTSVVIGVVVLDEHVRSGVLAVLGAVGGLAFVVVGVLALSSSSLVPGSEPAPLTVEAAAAPATAAADPAEAGPLPAPAGGISAR